MSYTTSTLTLFDQKSRFLFLLFILPLFFFPKINLITFKSETAGFRIDDLLLLLAFLPLFWAHFSLRRSFLICEKRFLIFVAASLFSFFLNQVFFKMGTLPVQAKILYCFRPIEYFLFFYIGIFAALTFNPDLLLKYFLGWNALLIFLQRREIIGGFTQSGYYNVSSRTLGICSFPNEMGEVLSLLFAYFLFKPITTPCWRKHLSEPLNAFFNQLRLLSLFLLFGILILLTGSRIALVAIGICAIARFYQESKRHFIPFLGLALLMTPVLIPIGSKVLALGEALYTRSSGLFSMNNLHLIGQVWHHIDPRHLTAEVKSFSGADMSWVLRIHKWCQAFKLFILHPECYLAGLGPGMATAALDGALLRLLVENGVLGLFLYFSFLRSLAAISTQLKWMIVVLVCNMLVIDAHMAYKAMSLLFFIAGAQLIRKEQESY